ncbi:shikimate dehydrogenase [Cellulomonas sp. Marseille-Q8402]
MTNSARRPGQRRAAVLGHPVAHSLSPRLHRAAYRALGLDGWTYEAVDVTEEQLPAFVAGLDGTWAGLSLTMPLKQTVIPLLDHVEPLAGVVGAVNTLLVQPGGRRPVLTGANTDVHGIVAALSEGLAAAGSSAAVGERSAVVLGAGATAASALAALAELGCTAPVVHVRSLGRVGGLARAAHRMGVEPVFRLLGDAPAAMARADLVVSTLPPRAADDLAGGLLTPRPGAVLLDVAYDPRPTALQSAWHTHGGIAVPGERMLLHQAVEQVRLMTGRPGPVQAMAAALDEALPAPV